MKNRTAITEKEFNATKRAWALMSWVGDLFIDALYVYDDGDLVVSQFYCHPDLQQNPVERVRHPDGSISFRKVVRKLAK